MRGSPIPYSAGEMRWLEENRMMPIREYHAGFLAAFDRIDVSAANLHSLRKRLGWKVGRDGRFTKGKAPQNKGKPMAPEVRAKVAATMFKKGAVPPNRLRRRQTTNQTNLTL